MFLSILIPTYNRVRDLRKNLGGLESMISELGVAGDVEVVVSNNDSSDDTMQFLENFSSATNINLKFYNQNINIGSVKNVLFLLENATTEYVMFLGDDDFISGKYLAEVLTVLRQGSIGVIVPSNLGVTEDGRPTGFARDVGLPSTYLSPGFGACLAHSWRGHQMSGLVFARLDLDDACKRNGIDNMYLFVFLVAYSALKRGVVHITSAPVLVTRPPQVVKGWSYGDDGLVGDFFDNYKRLNGISTLQRTRLELKLLDCQYWRYMMYIKLGPLKFLKALYRVCYGVNTSPFTGFLCPVVLPFFIVKRIFILFLSGELVRTLSRPVDI